MIYYAKSSMPERVKSAIIHAFEVIQVKRDDFGVAIEGDQIIVRIAGDGTIKSDGLEMINAYLAYKCGRDVKLSPHKSKFDFEDYRNTNLTGPGVTLDITTLIGEIEYLINKLLDDKDTSFKGSARKAVADIWKSEINNWLNK